MEAATDPGVATFLPPAAGSSGATAASLNGRSARSGEAERARSSPAFAQEPGPDAVTDSRGGRRRDPIDPWPNGPSPPRVGAAWRMTTGTGRTSQAEPGITGVGAEVGDFAHGLRAVGDDCLNLDPPI
jgi:hypothetical protein